jgi:glyoxylase-like metal-dependent hydrolase (beta-lactamase superfamily II)
VKTELPSDGTGRFELLVSGSVTATGGKVVSTCSLIRDEGHVIVVDPGMVDGSEVILDPLAALGLKPEEVTDVVLSHHYPDHTLRAGLFPNASVHDHWATYRGSAWKDADAEGRYLSKSVSLIKTPGHTGQDIATVVGTPQGLIVLCHLWWDSTGPAEDPYAEDPTALHISRRRVLGFAHLIVPGHGAPFSPQCYDAVMRKRAGFPSNPGRERRVRNRASQPP